MTCRSTFFGVQVTAKRRIAPMIIRAMLPPMVTDGLLPTHATVPGCPRHMTPATRLAAYALMDYGGPGRGCLTRDG